MINIADLQNNFDSVSDEKQTLYVELINVKSNFSGHIFVINNALFCSRNCLLYTCREDQQM